MLSFSQRKGLVPVVELIQIDSMNDDLKNSIWNVLARCVWNEQGFLNGRYDPYRNYIDGRMEQFSQTLWENFFKSPVDSRPSDNDDRLAVIRDSFFDFDWNEVYDFLEFVLSCDTVFAESLSQELNRTLEREGSAYRVVGGIVVGITSEQETAMLDTALRDTRFAPVASHLNRALELLADRENPDYRNSIKESISAIESMAKIVANDPKATLAAALKALEKNGQMHTALKEGFLKLYGYTNDEDGIRHAMLEESKLTASDAKYFLMSCTSFANYLKAQLPA